MLDILREQDLRHWVRSLLLDCKHLGNLYEWMDLRYPLQWVATILYLKIGR